jgi:hypothetical protein
LVAEDSRGKMLACYEIGGTLSENMEQDERGEND